MKVGSVVGHYHIVKSLGGGGMGAVYVANDTRLNRKVALKTLPARMANDPEWVRRFEREAQAVAALNHPNIVTIHSVEEAGDVHFIILEYVGGKTLEKLIPDTGLSIDMFFDVAIPLADALAAAHKRGIAHRDLKPSNIMLSDEGQVKVLDFGIAKLVEGLVTDDEAATSVGSEALTQEGKIVGTVAYMSPEQAEGKGADHRSDIFSLGIILYEMATGDRPFKGDTNLSILASIVKDQPTLIVERNVEMPRHLARIVKKALEKDLDRRYTSMVELRNDLMELKEEIDAGEALATGPVTGDTVPLGAATSGSGLLWKTAAMGAAVVAIAAIAWNLIGGGEDVVVEGPPNVTVQRLTSTSGEDFGGTSSPDGEWFSFTRRTDAATSVLLQSIDSRTPIEIHGDGSSPAFSPDGTRIAFSSPPPGGAGSVASSGFGGISIMGRLGDEVRRLTDFGFNPSWSPDGMRIVFGNEFVFSRPWNREALGYQLYVVDVATGSVSDLNVPDGVQPAWSPNGHRIAYWGSTTGQRDLYTVSVDQIGEAPDNVVAVAVTDDPAVDFSPAWSRDGNWLYWASARSGSMAIWRFAIDEVTRVTRGAPQQITTGGLGEPGMLSISADGMRLLYTESLTQGSISVADFDVDTLTVSSDMVPVVEGPRRFMEAAISPDGERIAYRNEGIQQDIFVARTNGNDEQQVTADEARDWSPRWSPDGQRIAFFTNASGDYEIWVADPDGTRPMQLTDTGGTYPIWSSDGLRLAYYDRLEGSYLIFSNTPHEIQMPELLPRIPEVRGAFQATDWHPDGAIVAGYYPRRRSNREHDVLYLFNVETGDYTHLGNGSEPRWMADGRRVLAQVTGQDQFFVIDTQTLQTQAVSVPVPNLVRLTLSPDNTRAYLGRAEFESDIWLLQIQ